MSEDWLGRWNQGRIGWHEHCGNGGLKKYWPALQPGSRVLVPLCGKAVDLLWLAQRDLEVTGVELSEIAVRSFFDEQGTEYRVDTDGVLPAYRATERSITLYCGDYFQFDSEPFDALFDRGALVAMPVDARPEYAAHTRNLLREDAFQLVITLEYDQSLVDGPPYSVVADELRQYWPELQRAGERQDSENFPPKFRTAGIESITESFWVSDLQGMSTVL